MNEGLLEAVLKTGSPLAILLLGIWYFIKQNERQNQISEEDKKQIVGLLTGVIADNNEALNNHAAALNTQSTALNRLSTLVEQSMNVQHRVRKEER